MRIFNPLSSCFCWLICAFYALGSVYIKFKGFNFALPRRPHSQLTTLVTASWVMLGTFTILAAGLWLVRRHFWFARDRPPGLGFWAVTLLFYILVVFATVSGYVPYIQGDRSIIQWVSSAMGIKFLVLGFPGLPRNLKS
jgi:hypothetical protein